MIKMMDINKRGFNLQAEPRNFKSGNDYLQGLAEPSQPVFFSPHFSGALRAASLQQPDLSAGLHL